MTLLLDILHFFGTAKRSRLSHLGQVLPSRAPLASCRLGRATTSGSPEGAQGLEDADDDAVDELEEDDVRGQLDGRLQVQVPASGGGQKGRIVAGNRELVL